MYKVWDDPLDVTFPDSISRPIIGLRVELEESTATGSHSHGKAELLYLMAGQVTVVAGAQAWVVPPLSALWIPSGVPHTTYSAGPLQAGVVFFELAPGIAPPAACQIVAVQPLMRELVMRALHIGLDPVARERDEHLAAILLDELATAPGQALDLPFPTDARLCRLAKAVIDLPSRQIGLKEWGARIGVGERTLNRLFVGDLGMTFLRWRQQLHVRLAIRHLTSKRPVGLIAFELGYESSSAFIAMFKSVTGATPARFKTSDIPHG